MDPVRAVAEPRRREILRLCWHRERTAGDIAGHFDVTFAAVSQHLAVLRDAGLVAVRQEGTRRFYRADHQALGPLAAYLESLWADQLDTLASLAERAEATSAADQDEEVDGDEDQEDGRERRRHEPR
jgi:DNA-binding transcriptional ArsR family regulator